MKTKWLSVLMVFILCTIMHMSLIHADTLTQDGLEITMTTDRDDYSRSDVIGVIITVKNVGTSPVNNVSIESVIPEGYRVLDENSRTNSIEILNPGETFELIAEYDIEENVAEPTVTPTVEPTVTPTVEPTITISPSQPAEDENAIITVKPTNTPTPSASSQSQSGVGTGDDTNIILWGMVVFVAFLLICVLAFIKKKRIKTFFIFLFFFMFLFEIENENSISVYAESMETQEKVELKTSVKVDDIDVEIKGIVLYDTPADNEETYTNEEWINILVTECGYPIIEDVTEYSHPSFVDSEYSNILETAVIYGILRPYEDDLELQENVTREFASVTALRCLGYALSDENVSFKDADELRYPKEVKIILEIGLMNLEDEYFYPSRALNAAEKESILKFIEDNLNTTKGQEYELNGFIFKENVIVLDADTSYSRNESILRLPVNDKTKEIAIGDYVTIGLKSAYKVEKLSLEGEELVIEYSHPEISEFLKSIDVAGDATLDFSQFIPGPGVSVSYNSANEGIATAGFFDDAFDVPENFAVTHMLPVQLDGRVALGNEIYLDYKAKFILPSLSYKFDIDFEPFPVVKNAYMKTDFTAEVAVAVSKNLDKNDEGDRGHVLVDDLIYTGQFDKIHLGSIPVVGMDGIGIVVEVDLVENSQGKIELQYNVGGTLGVQVLNNRPHNISALQSSASVVAMGEAKVGFEMGLVAEVFEEDLISFSGDLGARLGAEVAVHSTDLVCLDGGLTVFAELKAFENTLIDKWLDCAITWEIWNQYTSPVKLRIHVENFHIVPVCTYETGGTLKGRVADADDHSWNIEGAKIAVYNSLTMDPEPEKETISGADGRYTAAVPGGTHLIKISADGYLPFECLQTVMDKQEAFVETFLMVAGTEGIDAEGTIGGHITNSVTGSALNDVNLEVRRGWNIVQGDYVKQIKTNEDGNYVCTLPIGNYTILMKKNTYVTNHINVAVTEKGNMNYHGTLVPTEETSIPEGDFRVVLTWGRDPRDLDSHLWGMNSDGERIFHTYYNNKNYYSDGETQAFLDLDDTDSYGPETTTVYTTSSVKNFSYFVHDYTNRGSNGDLLAMSGAMVKVYVGEELIATYHVPTTGIGDTWHVFDYDAENKKITPINRFALYDDPQMVGYGDGIQFLAITPLKDYEIEALDSLEHESDDSMVETKTDTEMEEVNNIDEIESVEEKDTVEDLDSSEETDTPEETDIPEETDTPEDDDIEERIPEEVDILESPSEVITESASESSDSEIE